MSIPLGRDERGFTLIEVMIAATILLVGILGVAQLVNVSNGATTTSKAREQGLALARDLSEAARSVRYQSLRPGTVVPTLQAMPGLARSGSGSGWTIKRRGIQYTVAVGVCSVDDPSDGTGAHAAGAFCQRPSVQASAQTCATAIGAPATISGANGGGAAAGGDCGLDTNFDGQVDDLVQGSTSDCPSGTSIAAGTCDAQPDDFKRVVVLVTWDRGSGSRYVLQQATIPFPGLSAYAPITSLTLNGYSLGGAGYVVGDAPSSLTFAATTSQPANEVHWLLGGVDQGAFDSWSGSSGSFNWNLGAAPAGETSPAAGEVLDGTYSISARVQDAGGIHGIERAVTVVLNRRIPFAPAGFAIAGAALDNQGRPTQVQASWTPPPDRDVVGYTLFRQSGAGSPIAVSGCTAITARACTDTNPPMGSVTYWVKALDTDPSSGATRAGQASGARSIDVGNQPPTVPSFYDAKITGGGSGTSKVQLWWNASTDPDDAIDSYEVYRSGCSSTTLVGSALGTGTTLTDTTAPKNKTCTYTIRAKDVGGMYSAFSSGYQVST